MIKCEVIEQFSLKDFDKLVNLKRGTTKDKYGELYVTDTFECTEEMAKYLTGDNEPKKIVVKVIEVVPEKEIENVEEEKIEKPKKKKSSKK